MDTPCNTSRLSTVPQYPSHMHNKTNLGAISTVISVHEHLPKPCSSFLIDNQLTQQHSQWPYTKHSSMKMRFPVPKHRQYKLEYILHDIKTPEPALLTESKKQSWCNMQNVTCSSCVFKHSVKSRWLYMHLPNICKISDIKTTNYWRTVFCTFDLLPEILQLLSQLTGMKIVKAQSRAKWLSPRSTSWFMSTWLKWYLKHNYRSKAIPSLMKRYSQFSHTSCIDKYTFYISQLSSTLF